MAIDVYVSGAANVAAYEVALGVSAADAALAGTFDSAGHGQLVVEELFVDSQRADFLFGAVESISAADKAGSRLGGVVLGEAVDATEARYLGTFVLRA